MYGKNIWGEGKLNTSLEGKASQMFKNYCEFYAQLLAANEVQLVKKPTITTRIHWATLHGLARLYVDGVIKVKSNVYKLRLISETCKR